MIDRFSRPAFLLLFLAALALTLFMALDPAPPHIFLDRWGDKVEHSCAFITLALLARLAWPRMSAWWLLEHLSFLGAMIEVVQAIPSLHRDCDWRDWVADTLATALALFVASRIPALRAPLADHRRG